MIAILIFNYKLHKADKPYIIKNVEKNIINPAGIFCLIPAFDEKGNLAELTQRLVTVLQKTGIKFKIFFVLQGNISNRKTAVKLKREYPQVDFIYYPKALGIGRAYQLGFLHVDKKYSHILTLDADLNHQPEELPKFLTAWKKTRPDIIIGSRYIRGGKFQDNRIWKRICSFTTNMFVTKLLKIDVHDITSGYRLIRKEAAETIAGKLKEKGYPSYMEFILLAQKSGFSIKEIPISYIPRKWGKSKMGKITTLFNYFLFLPKAFLFFKNPD